MLLTCLADSKTPITYEWFKDGKRIPDDGMWKGCLVPRPAVSGLGTRLVEGMPYCETNLAYTAYTSIILEPFQPPTDGQHSCYSCHTVIL